MIAVDNLRGMLAKLNMNELKYLARTHGVKLRGRYVEGGLFENDHYLAPSKQRYVKELSKVVSETDVKSALNEMLDSRLRK